MKALVTALNQKIDRLESSLASAKATPAPANAVTAALKASPVQPHPSDSLPPGMEQIDGIDEPAPAAREPAAKPSDASGFSQSPAIGAYRQAQIFLQARRYADAIDAFRSFLENYADHPFAGSAQFYLGQAFFEQKQYREAITEFQRVLTAYDRSPQVPNSLRWMATAEENLGLSAEAANHRQQLSALFPSSPAAQALLAQAAKPAAASTSAPAVPSVATGAETAREPATSPSGFDAAPTTSPARKPVSPAVAPATAPAPVAPAAPATSPHADPAHEEPIRTGAASPVRHAPLTTLANELDEVPPTAPLAGDAP